MLNYGTQPDMLGSLTAAQRSIWAAQQLRPEVPYNFAAFFFSRSITMSTSRGSRLRAKRRQRGSAHHARGYPSMTANRSS